MVQVPVDEANLTWVEIATRDEYIGYMLATGPDVDAGLMLETSKGTIRVNPRKEYWFPASQNAVASLDGVESVEWRPLIYSDRVSTVISAIDGSMGLVDDEGNTLAFTGISGEVTWVPHDGQAEGHSIFEHDHADDAKRYSLGLQLDEEGLLVSAIWVQPMGSSEEVAALPVDYVAVGDPLDLGLSTAELDDRWVYAYSVPT